MGKNNKINKDITSELGNKKITRKEAIKKGGYAALSAATMMVLLSNKAHAGGPHTSPKSNNGNHYGNDTPDYNNSDTSNDKNGSNNPFDH